MGGLRKTTIERKVFNDEEIVRQFESRMWVCVSQNFSKEQIMRNMLRNLRDVGVGDDQGELLRINQHLLGNEYLIVIDDV
jgi:hypothetical protein